MKLYSGPISLFTAKIRVALAEKNLAYERVEVGYNLRDAYLPHHPEVARLNPKGEVPVLLDGDVVAYDSTLISEYLEERYPEVPLLPKDIAARTRARQLEAYGDEVLFPDLWTLISEGLYGGVRGDGDASALEAARAKLDDHYGVLDTALDGLDYLAGTFSTADIGNSIFINAAAALGAPVDARFENLLAWIQRVSQRPSIQTDTSEMQAYLAKAMSELQAAD